MAEEPFFTVLMIACWLGDLATAEDLMDHGADPTASSGHTSPMLLAARSGHADILGALVRRGADVNCRAPDEIGFTPLCLACASGSLEVVRLLLREGADVEAQPLTHAFTPIFIACNQGHADVVRELVAAGADLNRAVSGLTPLAVASQLGHVGVARVLLEAGASPYTPVPYGGCITVAALSGKYEVCMELAARGISIPDEVAREAREVLGRVRYASVRDAALEARGELPQRKRRRTAQRQ
eukprot:m51a1_g13323 putative ankyrin repeat (241) ;mRNA; r:1569-2291